MSTETIMILIPIFLVLNLLGVIVSYKQKNYRLAIFNGFAFGLLIGAWLHLIIK